MKSFWNNSTLKNLLTSGSYNKFNIEDQSRIIFINAIMLSGLILLLFFSTRAFWEGNFILGIINFSICLPILSVFIYLRRKLNFVLGGYFISGLMFIYFSYITISGGSDGSGILWMQSYSLICIFLLSSRAGIFFSLSFLILNSIFVFQPDYVSGAYTTNFKYRIIGVYVFIMVFSLSFEFIIRKAQSNLKESRDSLARLTSRLKDAKRHSDSIMENVEEGIFLLDNDLCFTSGYSKALEKIFEQKKLNGVSIITVLQDKLSNTNLSTISEFLQMLLNPKYKPELIKDVNPLKQITIRFELPSGKMFVKHLEFKFDRIRMDDGSYLIFGTVYDVSKSTELKIILNEKAEKNNRQMENLFQIIHIDPNMIDQFLLDADKELRKMIKLLNHNKNPSRSVLIDIYQSVHSIKGNSISLGLMAFSESIHLLENEISRLKEEHLSSTDVYHLQEGIIGLSREIREIKELIKKIIGFQTESLSSSYISNDVIIQALKKTKFGVEKETGKRAHLVTKNFDSGIIPEPLIATVKDVLIQLVRNSVYHGIESKEFRVATGKDPVGKIYLESQITGNYLSIVVQDDGQGLNLEKIKQSVKNNSSLQHLDIDSLPSGKILGLIFHPTFSTSEKIYLSAGRGIGMGIVKSKIEELGGAIKVKSAPGQACIFEIKIPL